MNNFIITENSYMLLDGVVGSSSEEPETHSTIESNSDSDSEILEQLKLNNSILVGIVLFLGVIVGCICMKLFYERFHK